MSRASSDYYHAHVYYEALSREVAARLREKVTSRFSGKAQVSRLLDRKVGPHPLPMFEIDFANAFHAEMTSFLEAHREGLNILVHQNTDDEIWNHTEGATWIGKPLTLDLDWLRAHQEGQF